MVVTRHIALIRILFFFLVVAVVYLHDAVDGSHVPVAVPAALTLSKVLELHESVLRVIHTGRHADHALHWATAVLHSAIGLEIFFDLSVSARVIA